MQNVNEIHLYIEIFAYAFICHLQVLITKKGLHATIYMYGEMTLYI